MRSPRQNHKDHQQQHHQHQQQREYIQRRHMVGSNFDLGIGGTLPSRSNWEGCLSDHPISNGPPSTTGPGSNWDRYDEKRGYEDESGLALDRSTTTPTFLRNHHHHARSNTKSGQRDYSGISGFEATSPMTATTPMTTSPITHSASMSTLRMFSPSTPARPGPSTISLAPESREPRRTEPQQHSVQEECVDATCTNACRKRPQRRRYPSGRIFKWHFPTADTLSGPECP